MEKLIATAAALAVAGPACAQTVTVSPLVDARTRYEHAAQDGIADDADALTVRVRTGVEAKAGGLSALVEGQGTLAVVDRYYDGLHGAQTRPLVADPQNVALYRAQLRYAGKGIALTAGRQRIALDDERFVGAIGFRDNGQTFDAVRAEIAPLSRLKVDLTYAWAQRTIWGIDGRGARQAAVSGDNVFANLGYRTRFGTLTAFAYLVDQDEAAVQAFRLSSQTYGGRFSGGYAFSRKTKLSYQLSYARQQDWHRNPNRYRADYYLADAALALSALNVGGGFEVLGADRGAALTSFQTPLATAFKFQGWADKFLTTPPDGVRDLYGNIGYGVKTGSRLGTIALQASYHRFDSDRLARHYGDELDLLASAKIGRTALSIRYADYRADRFATDTRKLWLQADWTL
ncbi:MAG: hypothetical protein PGN16_16740 [Sphingomonas phyllosphaerae]|uniref:alginate export family protein n=1 Tax=Sphingomonas phyllosphaerae TaxID=257003 RepID=UPI002FFBF5B6